MRRPYIAFTAIVALLAGGLYVGWQYRDKLQGTPSQTLSSHAARARIQGDFNLALPESAQNIYYLEEPVDKGRQVFTAFDVPTIELPAILDVRTPYVAFPAATDLADNLVVYGDFLRLANAQARRWWAPQNLREPRCAQRQGRRGTGGAQLKWQLLVCAAPANDARTTTTVYIAFTEEAAAGDEK